MSESMKEIFPGIFRKGREIYTINMVPGKKVYGEAILSDVREYREWNPRRSKLGAAIAKGIRQVPVRKGTRVLYLGASTGTTVSHISDIVGDEGLVYSVEFAERVFRELIGVARDRKNIVPILADARKPADYGWVEECEIVFCDLAQSDETEILIRNAAEFLAQGGFVMLSVKSQSIDVTKKPEEVYRQESQKLSHAGFQVLETIDLEPFEQKHSLILAKRKQD